ncbi:MAG: ribosome maturation factor RimP [Rhodospirillales bacterium]|nr:ribosome maturation factor RimP [Rhodospirillales bacterium]
MSREGAVDRLISPTLAGMGYALVRVLVSGGQRPTVQIMAERADGRPMSLDDCEAISRAVSAKLDVEDPIPSSYTLEVSSPGIDRPLVKPADFQRFAGFVARVETRIRLAGQRKFSGRINQADDMHVRLALDDGEVEIPFTDITRARLVLTDDLIAATAQSQPAERH